MFLVSVAVLVPVLLLAAGREWSPEVLNRLGSLLPADAGLGSGQLAVSFAAGLVIAGTPLHVLMRYLSTVVHELGHAFTAGLLGGRPRNITISLDASGLAVYQPPLTWGRGRASLVSFAGYPAPAVASLAAVEALRLGYSRTWFTFAAATLAVSIVLLIRNFWGFLWTSCVVAGSYLAAREVAAQYLGMAAGALAGYLALEGIRNARVQMAFVRRYPGTGTDAERIAGWWRFSPTFVSAVHFLTVVAISGYASTRALGPHWSAVEDFVRDLLDGS